MADCFFTQNTPINDQLLRLIAYVPTSGLRRLATPEFWLRLNDVDFMRIAVHLAQKSYDESGCPIGGVVVDNRSRAILGKGHNTLIQENDPYNHGETAAMRDAGSIDFSLTSVFTTLTPCRICATLLVERGVARVVIGNTPPGVANNEQWLGDNGLDVVALADEMGIELYARYKAEKPRQDQIDWRGIASLKSTSTNTH